MQKTIPKMEVSKWKGMQMHEIDSARVCLTPKLSIPADFLLQKSDKIS